MGWTRGQVLGRGSAATVSAATSTSGEVFAVKSAEFRQAESLLKEQYFLSMLKSPYVVGYKGCDTTREDNKTIYNVFLDYMSKGSISDMVNRRNGRLTDSEIVSYTRQMVQGLEYVHGIGIVHCDIKGGNVLVDESGAIKISDFGCAKWASHKLPVCGTVCGTPMYVAPETARGEEQRFPADIQKWASHKLPVCGTVCGTPMYMAPETARGEEQGFPADIWALGCTMIEMVTGEPPWPDVTDPVSVLYKIAFSGETPVIPDGFSDQAKDFVTKCLIRDPKQRWTAKDLLQHPYIQLQEFDENFDENLDENLRKLDCEKVRTDSPTSILDQDVWDSIKESSTTSSVGFDFPQFDILCLGSSNSLRQRVEQLVGKSEMPNWGCEKGETEWVTVRIDRKSEVGR